MLRKSRIAAAILTPACIALVSCTAKLQEAVNDTKSTLTCDDFTSSGTIDASLDVRVKAFLESAQEFKGVAGDVRATVKQACASIAADLGANDTWSALGDDDKSVSNGDGTGACDAAAARVKAVMDANAQVT